MKRNEWMTAVLDLVGEVYKKDDLERLIGNLGNSHYINMLGMTMEQAEAYMKKLVKEYNVNNSGTTVTEQVKEYLKECVKRCDDSKTETAKESVKNDPLKDVANRNSFKEDIRCNIYYEKGEKYTFVYELAGYTKEDVKIEYIDDAINISAISKTGNKHEPYLGYGKIQHEGITHRKPMFNDRFPLKVELSKIDAQMENGLLVVTAYIKKVEKPAIKVEIK
jgi:HSP20 family molecular chaperone IbpA